MALSFLIARCLTPNPAGVGTHEQLGLRPCFTMVVFHVPCPFCGMTTAFAYMVRGQPIKALEAQPAGALAFVVCALAAAMSAGVAITGRCPPSLRTPRHVGKALAVSLVVLLLAWMYKIAACLQ